VAGNGIATSYSYDPANRRLARLQSGLSRTPGEVAGSLQDLAYGYDSVGNILSLADSAPIPKSNEFGGQSTQNFHYDDLYRLIKAQGVYTTAREVQNYDFAMQFDAIHNITNKYQQHTVAKTGGSSRIETATSYDWAYAYRQRSHTQPHAPTTIGNRTFDYDENGNQTGWQNLDNGTRRTIVWDEDNRIREVQDPKHGAAFSYDDRGDRKLKKSQYGETAYINQFFTVRNGAIASTHVYAGTSRIVTKLGAGTPVGKVTNNTKGTGNLSTADASLTEYVAPDGTGTTTTTATTATIAATTTLSKGQGQGNKPTGNLAALGRGQGEGQANPASMGSFPGQGMAHRSERANEVARNSEKNKHLNGGDPGGAQGAVNSNAGGHESNAGGNGGGNAYAWGRSEQGRGNAGGNPDHAGGGQGAGAGSGVGSGGGSGNGAGNTSGGGTAGSGEGREFIYFYHPDHLGSTAYVTDEKAQRYEHLAYFPFGETWVQESTATWRVPYQYTAKEMDSETGLYYFGARYYDPRTSVWASADPILSRYLPSTPHEEMGLVKLRMPAVQNPLPKFNLPGMGGVFNPANLALFSYAHQNPLRYVDPDGRQVLNGETEAPVFEKKGEVRGAEWKVAGQVTVGNNSGGPYVSKPKVEASISFQKKGQPYTPNTGAGEPPRNQGDPEKQAKDAATDFVLAAASAVAGTDVGQAIKDKTGKDVKPQSDPSVGLPQIVTPILFEAGVSLWLQNGIQVGPVNNNFWADGLYRNNGPTTFGLMLFVRF
jgi:RHS repeat-associated protein